MKKRKDKLGIDIGRVIIGVGVPGCAEDTSFIGGTLQDALRTPPAEDAFETIGRLAERFEGRVWLVSKCGPAVQQKTRRWLRKQRFYDQTGVRQDRVRFCRKRPDKADICRELGITHFIDDRLDVLMHMRECVPQLFLFGVQKPGVEADWIVPVRTWSEVSERVLPV